ncbi:MAG: YraN family protein [Phycisphaeraceae bacterium]|nr:YraN family protein [Phycisphaeraceae bacterium]
MRTGQRDSLGPKGERAAARYLRRRGYRLLGRNLVTRFGEADLLFQAADGCIVLVEVKARRARTGAPPPESSVTLAKRQKLARILEHLVRQNGWTQRPRRIDVVAVEFQRRRWLPDKAFVRHIERAVGQGGGVP